MPYEPETIEETVENPMMKEAFKQFLKTEVAVNNINFCDKVDAFKAECSKPEGQRMNDEDLRRMAKQVYGDYLQDGSDRQVNLKTANTKGVEQGMAGLDRATPEQMATMFDGAQDETFKMMKGDNFPRFMASEGYKAAVAEVNKFQDMQKRIDQLKNNPSTTDKIKAAFTKGGMQKLISDAENQMKAAVEKSPINPKVDTNDYSRVVTKTEFEIEMEDASRGRSKAVTERPEAPKTSVRAALQGKLGEKPQVGQKVGAPRV